MRIPLIIQIIFQLGATLSCNGQSEEQLKIFIDCSSSSCQMDFIKTEIQFVDYTPDFKAADLLVLITQQTSGGGGSQFQLIFFGQNRFKGQNDTLRYDIKRNSTDFELREKIVKYLKVGILSFLGQSEKMDNYDIEVHKKIRVDSTSISIKKNDTWNYWVFYLNSSGSLNADQVYNSLRYSGYISATRITDEIKIRFDLSAGKDKTSYKFGDDSVGITKIIVNNSNYDFFHQIVKSLSQHWSTGYDFDISRSTFTNYKLSILLRPAIEYSVFPYSQVNTKVLTIKYGIDVVKNQYFDTTLYLKTKETLFGQGIGVALGFNQKWGTVSFSASSHSYINKPKYYNIGLATRLNLRITGGLSCNLTIYGSYLRDQVYLPKGQATEQEVLTRQRQLATNYTYSTTFGITYRFGSKVNNFVNTRFEGGSGGYYFF